ncbi:hypothetical protein FNV43_RR00085 [Rhamnella rubrinervis]|uniref:Transposase (putative) gypsy type domain-containing protein n=1 Tax=Rhamnella rubrinervis TaxID=2594499 RepID=A0A8K0HPW8_9ROSA|nr:hypothetical protein FNV43_RR00085 [Rhamnella rubrinervis]
MVTQIQAKTPRSTPVFYLFISPDEARFPGEHLRLGSNPFLHFDFLYFVFPAKISSEESYAPLEPYLVYSDPCSDSTPSSSSANSSVRVFEPNQVAEQNLALYIEPSAKRDDLNHSPKFFIQHPILIKTDIPSVFKPKDMSYLKERYGFSQNVVLSVPKKGERADSVRKGWTYFYEIAFKLGLRLPFHNIINMILNYFNLASGQLMPNNWRYLLGLIVLSERVFDPAWHADYRVHSFGLRGYWTTELQGEEGPSKEPTEQTPEGIPFPISEVPYMHALKVVLGCYTQPTTSGLHIHYRYGKNEVTSLAKIASKEEAKAFESPTSKDKGKVPQTPDLGLEDSASVSTEPDHVAEVVDSLMTRHDRVILKGMSFDEINHEAEQCALKIYSNLNIIFRSSYIGFDHSLFNAGRSKLPPNKLKKLVRSGLKFGREEELRNLTLDFSRIASERDDLLTRATDWPRKKKIVYRKGVEDAFLKARREMIRRFKARETNWPTLEPSYDEEGNNDSSEISSEEDEAEDDSGGERNKDIQPKELPPAPEESRSPTRDSFVEAMEAARFENAGQTPKTKLPAFQLLGVLKDLAQYKISNPELAESNLGIVVPSNTLLLDRLPGMPRRRKMHSDLPFGKEILCCRDE